MRRMTTSAAEAVAGCRWTTAVAEVTGCPLTTSAAAIAWYLKSTFAAAVVAAYNSIFADGAAVKLLQNFQLKKSLNLKQVPRFIYS